MSLKDYNNMCVDPSIRMSQTDSNLNFSRGIVTALGLGRWTLSLNIGWHIFFFFRFTFSSTLRSTAYSSCPHVACVLLVTFLSLFLPLCFLFFSISIQQLMQQQAALMAASHGGYLAPSVAFPTTQIHQMGAININNLPPTPMTPVSGEFHQTLGEQQCFISSLTGWGLRWRVTVTLVGPP